MNVQPQPPLGAPHTDATASFLSLDCFFLRRPPQFLPSSSSSSAIPAISHYSHCNPLPQPPSHSRLQPSVAHTHTVTTSSLLFPFFPAPHLPPLPPLLCCCRQLLLLPRRRTVAPPSLPAAATHLCLCHCCCRSRLQPCPTQLLPFAATSVAATPHRTLLRAGLPLLLPRRTPLLVGTRCPSLLSASL
ncbi:hypothetical protein B296_00052009 [Ensete ventricosum]|uniref:Uncharacterized protein n=1 Tax=Ensete ventricosum TaxID=4639 RepID=A0A426X9U9_ENSVE|nr:hypothetical protein B296_00052009 [Ensete ventricosum]